MTSQTVQQRQAEDLAAIRQAALDYAQGWYEGDAERMRRCLHPELAKRRILCDPLTGEEGFRHVTRQLLLDLTQQGGGSDEVPADKRTYDVTILDVCGEIASVRADTTDIRGLPASGAQSRTMADRQCPLPDKSRPHHVG